MSNGPRDLWRLLCMFRPYLGWMALGVLLSLATLIANVGLMAISGWFIASMAVAGAAGVTMNYFTPAAIIRFFAIVRTAGRYAERLVTHEATLRLLAQLRVWFYRHLEPLAPARLQHYRSGDLLSRIRADIDSLDNLYLRILVPVSVALLGAAGAFAFLSRYDTSLAAINLGFLLLAGVAVPLWVKHLGREPGRRMVATSADLRTAVVDGLQGLSEQIVYQAVDRQAQCIDRLSRELSLDQDRMSHLSGISQGAVGLSANLSLWWIALTSIPLIGAGVLDPVDLAMLSLFTLASFEAVMPLPLAFQMLGQTLTAARRVFEIVDARPEAPDPDRPSPSPRNHSIRIEDLSFRYAAGQPLVLDGIDLQLDAGQRVAIMGATGSGKSTLIHLLLRFWDPVEGAIFLGGHNLKTYAGDDLRRHIAVVSQHTHLFNATIRDNLLLANPQASDAALDQACRRAGIDQFITDLPHGYDTWVGEAALKLSGGQARRIAIARALLKDAPILVLDEPTEGLDPPTERAVMASVLELMAGRSVLLVTHRPTALQAMDEVLVLDSGRIVERGAPSDLARRGEYYRRLTDFFVAAE